ncbi:MAG: TIGR03986 family CRISPR-associated RAMP protein [Candidatus Marinimicrobia bacterium]|nr:TIGR03986 family CRISPR-associated RAMP protein [Candidatus Neomarinimicrobiota bacterium]
MEKGIFVGLNLSKKKGTISGHLQVKSKKYDLHSSNFILTMEMNNQECNVEIVNGNKIGSVIFKGTEINKEINKPVTTNQKSMYEIKKEIELKERKQELLEQNNKSDSLYLDPANAPYNFVPVNKDIVEIEKPKDFDTYHDDKNTGYIDLEIETKTPLFIGDNENSPEFYNKGGQYRIPGSSMRGMLRNLVEIASYSRMEFVDDTRLFYRSFSDKCHAIRDEYKNNMIPDDTEGNSMNQMKSGVLYKCGLDYFIIPSPKPFESIDKKESKPIISKLREQYREPGYYKVNENKYIVVPGKKFWQRNQKKMYDYIVWADLDKNSPKLKQLSERDIDDYREDKNRSAEYYAKDLLKETQKTTFVPCFYVDWKDKDGNNRISFGHTKLFRLAYYKTICQHLPKPHQNEDNLLDIATAIFGKEEKFPTRLFIEDMIMNRDSYDKVSKNFKYLKILGSPNPTSFQLYLEQSNKNIRKLKHYNDDVLINGYKMYWHKSGENWFETDNELILKDQKKEISKQLYQAIKPIDEGATFKGRIRFENLTDEELGALMFVINLPNECCHKIGKGKPYGLGSIKIKSQLHLSDRKKRYSDFFAELNEVPAPSDPSKFTSIFEKLVMEKLNETSGSLWNIDRLKVLKRLLDFDNKPNDLKTKYMELDTFKNRQVLPNPLEVKLP